MEILMMLAVWNVQLGLPEMTNLGLKNVPLLQLRCVTKTKKLQPAPFLLQCEELDCNQVIC